MMTWMSYTIGFIKPMGTLSLPGLRNGSYWSMATFLTAFGDAPAKENQATSVEGRRSNCSWWNETEAGMHDCCIMGFYHTQGITVVNGGLGIMVGQQYKVRIRRL